MYGSVLDVKCHLEMHFDSNCSSENPGSTLPFTNMLAEPYVMSSESKCPLCDFESDDYPLMVSHVEMHFDSSHALGKTFFLFSVIVL